MEGLEPIRTFNNSGELISFLTSLSSHKSHAFRGYGKQSELYPNIIRDKDWRNYEIELLSNFERFGLQYFSANNPIDFMSYAQHYGLPTRLLDFTYNPFIALSFALFMPKSSNYKIDDDKTYYYVRYCKIADQNCFRILPHFNDDQIFCASSFTSQCKNMIQSLGRIIAGLSELYDEKNFVAQLVISYFKLVYTEINPGSRQTDIHDFKQFMDNAMQNFVDKRILFVDANQCNQRIVMQQGLFMFPYTLNREKHKEIIERNTVEIRIHKDIRDDLLDYLNTIGINSYRLMPDIQSVCSAVKREVIEERQGKNEFNNIINNNLVDQEKMVLDFIEKNKNVTLKEISEQNEIAIRKAQNYVEKLIKKGLIKFIGKDNQSTYSINEE